MTAMLPGIPSRCPTERPCPYVQCKWHLALDGAGWHDGSARASCSLDIMDQGSHTLNEIGDILCITRERVRQIEYVALRKLAAAWLATEDEPW